MITLLVEVNIKWTCTLDSCVGTMHGYAECFLFPTEIWRLLNANMSYCLIGCRLLISFICLIYSVWSGCETC